MNATDVEPSTNGTVKRIARKGRVQFAFGEDDPAFTIDVTEVNDQWYVIDQSFRDAEGGVPIDKINERNAAMRLFVAQTVAAAYAAGVAEPQGMKAMSVEQIAQTLTLAEVSAFINMVGEEVVRVRNFYYPPTPKPPSSVENSETRFSQ